MQTRIAVVQHGNLPAARRLRAAGEPEPYYGMHYSQGFLDAWLAPHPHLVISLDGPPEVTRAGNGVLKTVPPPRLPLPLPGSATAVAWSALLGRELLSFGPTHFLLRANDLVAVGLLRLAARKNWSTLAMFAGFFRRARRYDRFVSRELVRMLNRPNVARVGNHRAPATQSMVDAGLDPRKAAAWDYVVTRTPAQYPARDLPPGPVRLFMAGSLIPAKGVGDLIDAAVLLRERGAAVRLVVGGTSALFGEWVRRAAPLGEAAEFLGQVSNDRVVQEDGPGHVRRRPDAAGIPGGLPDDVHREPDRPHPGDRQHAPGVHPGAGRRRGGALLPGRRRGRPRRRDRPPRRRPGRLPGAVRAHGGGVRPPPVPDAVPRGH